MMSPLAMGGQDFGVLMREMRAGKLGWNTTGCSCMTWLDEAWWMPQLRHLDHALSERRRVPGKWLFAML